MPPYTCPTYGISIGPTLNKTFAKVPPTLLSNPSESKKSYLFHLLPSTVNVSDICRISFPVSGLFPNVS
jgi:hypothetical protein|nr:MAG: hypothetical protein [Bacteriophage sp.]